jgi:hypothetical protein
MRSCRGFPIFSAKSGNKEKRPPISAATPLLLVIEDEAKDRACTSLGFD